MADVVARHRITVGTKDGRKSIEPGTRFNTDDYGLDAEQVEKWKKNGTIRDPRDQGQAAEADARVERGVATEGRTPIRDASGAPVATEGTGPRPSVERNGSRETERPGAQAPEHDAAADRRQRRGTADL